MMLFQGAPGPRGQAGERGTVGIQGPRVSQQKFNSLQLMCRKLTLDSSLCQENLNKIINQKYEFLKFPNSQ